VQAGAKAEAIEFAGRAMKRSAAGVHREMSQGLSSLATVVCVAPFFGVLGTVIGIVNSWHGIAGQRDIGSDVIFSIARACALTALGLLVAVPSLWFYTYLAARVECFDREMEAATIDVLSLLSLRPMHLATPAGISLVPEAPTFRDHVGRELREERLPWYRSSVAAAAMLIVAWCVHIVRNFGQDSLPLGAAATWAVVYLLFTFAVSWFVAYPVWVKIFRRASGGMAVLTSFLCLCWSLTELWWGAHLW